MTDASFDYTTRILWPAETEFMVPAADAAFSPSSLPGLKFWYDATVGVFSDAGTTPANNDDTVQQWNDQSASAAHLKQPTSGDRPTYKTTGLNSLPTVRCVGDWMLSDANSIAMGDDECWCFIVLNPTSVGGVPGWVGYLANGDVNTRTAGSADFLLDHTGASNTFFGIINAQATPQMSLIFGTPFQWGSVANGATAENYENGVASGSPTVVTGSLDATGRIVINNITGTGANAGTVDLSEIFGGTGPLSAGDLTNIFTYLAAKWGL